MTENEARTLVNSIAKLCHEYEKNCGCVVKFNISEERISAFKTRFLRFDGSVKIDK